jgi:YVTN family beta-propeller protein
MNRTQLGSLIAALTLVLSPSRAVAQPAPLELEAKIPLGDVSGRIDHLAIDLARKRLFVAELGNDSVGIVDLEGHKVLRTITGLRAPQGVGYVASTDTLYVANADDGTVRLFQGGDYVAAGKIELGDDADNVRVDEAGGRVFVGYGKGGIAVIDAQHHGKIGDIQLKAHPEGFQLAGGGGRIFVNLPDAHEIAVVDRGTGKVIAGWPTRDAHENFPLAIDESAGNVLAAFRSPAMLGAFAMEGGVPRRDVIICGDADDVFVDARRGRIYVSCGQGFIDVLDARGGTYGRIAHIATVSGARTALFAPELDRLFLAVRARAGQTAAIWVFRPEP